MSSTGIRLLSPFGFLALVAFFGAGIYCLIIPPPPQAIRGLPAASLCLLGVVVWTVTNCIAFFLALLGTAKDRQEAEAILRVIFRILSSGFAMIGSSATASTPSNRRRRHGGRSS